MVKPLSDGPEIMIVAVDQKRFPVFEFIAVCINDLNNWSKGSYLYDSFAYMPCAARMMVLSFH